MINRKIKLGQAGEQEAVTFLERQGYRILERNFRNPLGEIDIIAKEGDTICFIEVKTRSSQAFGSPFESVTPAKQRKIIHVALSYLKSKGREESKARFDVIAVCLEQEGPGRIEMIKNAFETD
ncbi:MAG TPA: YraN family protein [Candidatus Omnitrophota bacterium]|nr:YraN family protein [Candidatus Omnitrophota bacterium]